MKVNGVLLDRLVLEEEYVAVLFLGECLEEEKVLVRHPETLPKLQNSPGSLRRAGGEPGGDRRGAGQGGHPLCQD